MLGIYAKTDFLASDILGELSHSIFYFLVVFGFIQVQRNVVQLLLLHLLIVRQEPKPFVVEFLDYGIKFDANDNPDIFDIIEVFVDILVPTSVEVRHQNIQVLDFQFLKYPCELAQQGVASPIIEEFRLHDNILNTYYILST